MRKRGFLRLSYVVPPQSDLSVLVKPCTVTRKGYEDTSYVFPTWSPACGGSSLDRVMSTDSFRESRPPVRTPMSIACSDLSSDRQRRSPPPPWLSPATRSGRHRRPERPVRSEAAQPFISPT